MKHFLSEDDQQKLDHRIKDAERRTGAQFVLAVIEKSDAYPEVPWRAFALGVSIAALVFFVKGVIATAWPSSFMMLMTVALIIGSGALMAIFSIFFKPLSRVFLTGDRIETEVKQYAESLFLERELFATKSRCGMLILISLFERQVVMLPDSGLHDRLNNDVLTKSIQQTTRHLKTGSVAEALDSGLQYIIEALGAAPSDEVNDELFNEIIQQEGE